MLSDQIYLALSQGHNRFQLCRMTARGVKVLHKPGTRFEDTIGLTLKGLSVNSRRSEATRETPVHD